MNSVNDCYELRNGVKIPCIGYGTWQTPDGETAVKSVRYAIESGYRHIDGAAVYGNEASVGQGIKEGLKAAGIKREELFVTSKVWNTDRGYDKTIKACEKSLKDFGLDYFDLYLIHWPANEVNCGKEWDEMNLDTWRAMTDLYQAGKVRAVGVSNFLPHHLESLMKMEVPPMVDQIECHPGLFRRETIEYCKKNGIAVEAWSPMGSGAIFQNQTVKEIAEKYKKSIAHICIRWCMQHDVIPLPKSVTPSSIKDNMNVFDFQLEQEDMDKIDRMEQAGYSGNDPDTFHVF